MEPTEATPQRNRRATRTFPYRNGSVRVMLRTLLQHQTHREIAIELGVSERTIYRWDNGECWPRGARLAKLIALSEKPSP